MWKAERWPQRYPGPNLWTGMLPLVGKEAACEGAEGLEMGPLSWSLRWPSVQVSLYKGGRGDLASDQKAMCPSRRKQGLREDATLLVFGVS